MSRPARNEEAQGRVEAELAQERAAALGRIGHRLDDLIGQLLRLRAAYGAAGGGVYERRVQVADEHRQLRHEALRGGHRLDGFYRVPDSLEP